MKETGGKIPVWRAGFDIDKYPAPIPQDFWTSEEGRKVFANAKPIKNTIRIAATFASMGATVTIATKRPPSGLVTTVTWFLENNIPQIFYPQDQIVPHIMFVHNKLEAEADIYIEDDPAEIQRLAKAGKTILIPEWAYNKNLTRIPQLIYYNVYQAAGVGEENVQKS